MPTLEKIKTETIPVVLLEGDDPLVAYIYKNKRTRTNRDKVRAVVKDITGSLDEMRAEVGRIEEEATALDKSEEIAAKRAALDAATEEQAPALQAELTALEAEQAEAQPRIQELLDRMAELVEQGEEAAHKSLAAQMEFWCESTNITETADPDSPLVPSTAEFWAETFDFETLQDFLAKVGRSLEGPLAMRLPSLS